MGWKQLPVGRTSIDLTKSGLALVPQDETDAGPQTPQYRIPSAKASCHRIQAAIVRSFQALMRHSECRSRVLAGVSDDEVPWQYVALYLVDKHPEHLAHTFSDKPDIVEGARTPTKGKAAKTSKGGQKGSQKGKSEQVRKGMLRSVAVNLQNDVAAMQKVPRRT